MPAGRSTVRAEKGPEGAVEKGFQMEKARTVERAAHTFGRS